MAGGAVAVAEAAAEVAAQVASASSNHRSMVDPAVVSPGQLGFQQESPVVSERGGEGGSGGDGGDGDGDDGVSGGPVDASTVVLKVPKVGRPKQSGQKLRAPREKQTRKRKQNREDLPSPMPRQGRRPRQKKQEGQAQQPAMPLWSNPPQPAGGASGATPQAGSALTTLSHKHQQDRSTLTAQVAGSAHMSYARQLLEQIPHLAAAGKGDVARQFAEQEKRQAATAAAAALTAAAVPQLRSFGPAPPQGQPEAVPSARPRLPMPMSPLVTSRACLPETHDRQQLASSSTPATSSSQPGTLGPPATGVAVHLVGPSRPLPRATTQTVASAGGPPSVAAAAGCAGQSAADTPPNVNTAARSSTGGNAAAMAAAAAAGVSEHNAVFVEKERQRQLQRRKSDVIFKSRPSSGSWPAMAAQAAAEAAADARGIGGAGEDPSTGVAWPPQSPAFVNGKAYTGWGQTLPPLELGTSQGAAVGAMSSSSLVFSTPSIQVQCGVFCFPLDLTWSVPSWPDMNIGPQVG